MPLERDRLHYREYGYMPTTMSECYCTSLRSAARHVTGLYDRAIAPTGVNTAQFSLMRAVERSTPVTLTELAKRTDLDRSTVGRNIRVIERMGLVEVGSSTDKREATVSLTKAGHHTLAVGAPLWDSIQEKVEAAMGVGTAHAFRDTLQSLRDNQLLELK